MSTAKWNNYGKEGRVPIPCWTCGKPSDSWFADGSPKWTDHQHPAMPAVGPSPYYADDLVTIYHADFRDVSFDAGDVLVADPPFDIWADVAYPVKQIETETIVAFTNWQNRRALDLYKTPRAELVWTFADGRWVSHNLPRLTHETILVWGKTQSAYVGRPMSHVEPQRKGAGHVGRDRMPERTWRPRDRAMMDSHLAYPRDVASGTWSKPLPLVEQLLQWLCPPGGTVLDPFTGTGTVLVAAKALGMRSIGCDISEQACEIAAQRCSQEVLGLPA